MVLRRVLPIIACSALIATATAQSTDTPAIRAAKFYAAGLERPLMELRRGALLVRACDKMRKACTKEQRELAVKSRTVTLLDELTLFPERPDDPAAGVARASLLKERISEAGASLMRAAGEYDRALIARYGAALRVCPGDSGARYHESLEALTASDLRQFQGLEDAAYVEARISIADAETEVAEVLRKLPAEDCDAILTAGQLLMEMMNGKLEPWTRESRRVANAKPEFDFDAVRKPPPPDDTPTRDVAVSIAGNFVTLVATELQLQVFPETAPRIKAIAEAEGIGPAG
jgi:hypothetical protein